jgi:hypothetical protein
MKPNITILLVITIPSYAYLFLYGNLGRCKFLFTWFIFNMLEFNISYSLLQRLPALGERGHVEAEGDPRRSETSQGKHVFKRKFEVIINKMLA